ncbi:MAG: Asp23/Gls24 family envelope stress response protein [Oscillospiraceae bacterium]|nr:Asp23/Gls24 family envelope stress response protein [Oscillospiraceae bacterium]
MYKIIESNCDYIFYSNNLLSLIVKKEISEIEGFYNFNNKFHFFDYCDFLNFLNRAIKIYQQDEDIYINLYINIEYNQNFKKFAKMVSDRIKYAIYDITGLNVKYINIYIDNIVFV